MENIFYEFCIRYPKEFFNKTFSQVAEINKKYATPQVKTSRAVKFALVCLRIYLIILLCLLFYKFYITLAK